MAASQAILFDYGGTLDADGRTWLERFWPLYEEQGVRASREDYERAFYDADDHLSQRHRLEGLDLEQTVLLQVRDVLSRLAPERVPVAEFIAGRFSVESRRHFAYLKPVLERLASRYRLGVVSNFYGNLEGILKIEGLLYLFKVVADSGTLGIAKPEAGIFLHAARGVQAEPSFCVMVGDSPNRDIAGAARVGMRRALICARNAPPQAGQDWTLRSVADLEAALS